ncbi:MAG: hypothetical protein RL113_989 [Pseudomonadota bacterium]|jgi:hypothetical protein
MKHFLLFTLLGATFLVAEEANQSTKHKDFNQYLSTAVNKVEAAREDALEALDRMVKSVNISLDENVTTLENINTEIIKAKAMAEIAQSKAEVQIAKTKAITRISKAVDQIDQATAENRQAAEDAALATIIEAVSSVELAKANTTKKIVEATHKVEMSKIKAPKEVEHPKETLSITKSAAEVAIAKSESDVAIAKSNSLIEIARSAMKNIAPTPTKEERAKLKILKAQATAKITSYLAEIEIFKTKMLEKIAEEVAKVEVAEILTGESEEKND